MHGPKYLNYTPTYLFPRACPSLVSLINKLDVSILLEKLWIKERIQSVSSTVIIRYEWIEDSLTGESSGNYLDSNLFHSFK